MVLKVYSTRMFLALISLSVLVAFLTLSLLTAYLPVQNPLANEPGFTLSPSPASLSLLPGSTGTYIIQADSTNGFSGTVDLEAELSPHVSNGPRLALGGQVAVSESGSGSTTLTVSTFNNAFASTQAGLYTITVTGTSGLRSNSASLNLNVADFLISTGSSGVGIPVGSSGSLWVTLTSASGFAGIVDLTASASPAGLAASLTPSRLTLSAGSRVASTLYLGPMPPTAPPRQFSVTVTGQSTGVAHSRSIMVAAGQEGPDFSIACCGPTNDGSISVHSGETYDSWMSVSALNNFTGTISLAVNLPFAATIDPSIVSLPAGQNASFVVRPSVSISVPASIASGVYGGILTGTSGSLSHTFTLSVTVATPPPDFSLKVAETFLNIPQSSSATTTLTLTSINGLAGPISLSPTVSPEPECNPQVSVDPGTITLSAGETKTAVLTVTVGPLPLGSNATHFQIMVTGTYQSSTAQTISHEVTIDAYILPPPPDFMLEVQPSTMTLSPGTSGTFYLTITSLNDFAGQVVLSTSLSLHTVLEPPQVTLAPGENAEATLTVNIPQGTVGGYSGSVTASTGERISSIQVSVTVSPTTEDPYFELTATPSSIGPLLSGETGSTTIYVNPQGGFTGNVTIWALSNSSSGFVFSLDRIWVMSSGDVTLTISAEFPGNYTIVVTGTSGGLTHSVYVLIIVADQPTSDLTLSASQALATGESPDPHSFLPAYSERQ